MIAERLRQARLVAGLTQADAVAKLGELEVSLTSAGLSKYERGGSTPPSTLLLKLAKVYGVKPRYFLVEPQCSVTWFAFRRHASLGQRKADWIKAVASESIAGQVWLMDRLNPDCTPRFPEPAKVSRIEDAESVADSVRQAWGLGNSPIGSVTQTIENNHGIVCEYETKNGEFDGLAGLANDRFPVMVIASGIPDDRKRFNLAHEIGHLVMDSESLDEKAKESFAHRFAGAFLVPATTARAELGDKRKHLSFLELAELKKKYGLSMQAWLHRARDLSIINESRFQSLCIQFSSRGWRKQEPVGYTGNEVPVMLKQMTLRALAEGIITPEKAESLCPNATDEKISETEKGQRVRFTADEILKLPPAEKKKILAFAAEILKEDYKGDPELTAFDAFQEEE